MYHNHSSPGVLQLPWCVTTSHWNVVQLPIGMHIIMLQLPLVCCNDTRKPMHTGKLHITYILEERLFDSGFKFIIKSVITLVHNQT